MEICAFGQLGFFWCYCLICILFSFEFIYLLLNAIMLITPQGLCSARLLIPYWEMYGSWEIKDFQEAVSGFTTSEPSAISCVWGERQDWHTHPGTDGWRWPSWVHCCPNPFPALCTWAMLNLVFSGADRFERSNRSGCWYLTFRARLLKMINIYFAQSAHATY